MVYRTAVCSTEWREIRDILLCSTSRHTYVTLEIVSPHAFTTLKGVQFHLIALFDWADSHAVMNSRVCFVHYLELKR